MRPRDVKTWSWTPKKGAFQRSEFKVLARRAAMARGAKREDYSSLIDPGHDIPVIYRRGGDAAAVG